MTYYLPGSVKVTLCHHPKNRALHLCSEHLGIFMAVTFNNRISAKLSSKKKKKAEEGKTA